MHRRISWLLLLSITLSLVPVSLPAPIASFFSLEDLAIQTAHAAEGINRTIHYQGKVSLSAGSAVGNGSYNMRFRIYAASTGGAPLWSETWDSATTRVTMTGGLFSLALGTHTTMTGSVDFNSDSLYLQIEFDPGNDDTYEEVFTPRRRFASVPYAHNAERLAGLLSTQFLRSDQPATASGKLTITAPGLGLDIKGTASGSTIHASTQLSTSGTLVVNGVTTLKNYTSCSLITTDTAGNLGCGTSTVGDLSLSYADSRYVNRSGDTMTGGLLIVNGGDGTQAIEAGLLLEIAGTASGRVLHAQDQLRSSGSLIVAGQSFLQGTLFLQNLLSCTAFATTSSGALQCASAVAGFDQSVTDARYVQIQGDTMTGGLLIVSGGNGSQTIEAGLLLEIGGTASGYILHAQDQLRSSGSLIVEGNAVFDTSTLIVDATNNRVGIGTTSPSASLEILNAAGSQLRLGYGASTATELLADSNGLLTIQSTNTTAIQTSLYQQTTPTADVAFAYLNFKANSTQAAGSWTTSYDTTAYAIYSFAFDSTHTVLYAATDNSGIIYRCDPSTSCDASGDWTTSYDSSSSSIVSLLFDSTNGVLYAGAGNGGIIYRCDTSTSCDAGGDWTTSYDSVETSILSLTIDTTHSVLYAGTANAGIIYRCDLITNCDADGDWTTSYDTPDYSILSLTFDAANGILYAGAYNTGSIYRCDTSTNCDASGDWTVSYDTSASYIYALTIDTTHGVLYAGTDNSGIIYRCETSTNCDASGDWTTSYDSPAGSIDSFAFDSVNGVLYAGAHNGDIYSCDTSTSCDAGGDWATSLDTAESAILAVVVDSNNGAVYAGSQGNGIIYRKVIGSTQTSTYAAIQAQTSNSGYSTASGSLVFLTQNRGTLTEGMRLNGFGNLGLGTTTPGSRLSVSGSVIIGSNIGSARADTNIALEIAGTASGRILHAQDQLRSSGSLTVQTTGLFKGNLTTRGRLSGATLTVSSNAAISGALLVKGNITTKSALSGAALTVTSLKSCTSLQTDSNGALSCASQSTGSVSTGSLITAFDKRYVNTSGDTMTGGLLIVSTAHNPGTIEAGLLLEIGGAMSGYILHAQNALTSSGMLTVRVKRSTGALIYGSGSNTPVLALDSYYNSGKAPHIIFGYRGTFDTALWRSGVKQLSLSGSLLPGQSNRFDLGSNTMRWRDLYLSGSSLHIGSSTLEGKIGYRSTGFEGMTFFGSGGAVSPSMIISSGGLVGIGTSTPKAKLSVAGTMSGRKLNIGGVDLGESFNLLNGNVYLKNSHIYLQDSVPTFTTDIYQTSTQTRFTNNAGAILLTANTNANTDYTKPGLSINTSNNVGIGLDTTGLKLQVQASFSAQYLAGFYNTANGTTAHGVIILAGSNTTGGASMQAFFRPDGTNIGNISQASATTVAYNTTSDARLKQNILASTGGLSLLNQINVRDYDFIGDPEHTKLQGFLAQELYNIYPQAVTVGTDEVNGSGKLVNPWGVDYGKLTPLLVLAVQQLDQKIQQFQNNSGATLSASNLSLSGALIVSKGARFGSGVTIALPTTNGTSTALQVVSNVGSTNNTVFKVNASGAVFADGTFTGGGADYAEWFLSSTPNLQYGEAVCVDTTRSNTVTRCTRSGDLNIIGVVSSPKQAAFIGNKFAGAEGLPVPNTVLVGLVGQLSANMMVESGATIRQGDALAAASIPGYLRKAQPGEASVGIALEELLSGKGFRKILISPRNRSLTAESVSARVEQSIAAMNIQDQVQQKVRDAVTTLGTDGTLLRQVEDQLTTLGVTTLESRIAALEVRVATGATAPTPSSSPVAGEGCPPSTELRTSSGRGGGSCAFTGSLFITGDLTASALSLDDTLTVGSDARIAGDLYLDGTLNVQSLFIPGIVTIDGALWANTLTIASGAVIRGALDIYHSIQLHSGATVNFASGSILDVSSLIVRNALQVLGPITIGGLAEFLGDVNIQGTLSVSSRQAGFVTVPKTGSSVTILFEHPFATEPVINVTPNGRVGTEWWVEDSSASGFTIRTGWYLQNAVRFSWFAVGIVQTSATGSLQMDTLPSENSPEILSSSSSSSVSSGSSGEVLPVGSAASSVSSASGSGAAVPVMGPVTSSGGAFILPPAAGSSSSVSNGSAASSSAQAAPVVSSSSASAASTSSAAAATSSSAASAVSSAQASSSAEVLPPAAPVSNEPESAPESVPAQTSAPESTPAEVSVPQ